MSNYYLKFNEAAETLEELWTIPPERQEELFNHASENVKGNVSNEFDLIKCCNGVGRTMEEIAFVYFLAGRIAEFAKPVFTGKLK